MAYALVYAGQRFFYRIWQFLAHWYAHGFLIVGGRTISALEYFDQIVALRITLRFFWQPLYRDYSVIGYFIGIPARAGRVFIGVVTYAIVFAIAAGVYLAWAAIPLYLLFNALQPLLV